jgi:hypothetical protein
MFSEVWGAIVSVLFSVSVSVSVLFSVSPILFGFGMDACGGEKEKQLHGLAGLLFQRMES